MKSKKIISLMLALSISACAFGGCKKKEEPKKTEEETTTTSENVTTEEPEESKDPEATASDDADGTEESNANQEPGGSSNTDPSASSESEETDPSETSESSEPGESSDPSESSETSETGGTPAPAPSLDPDAPAKKATLSEFKSAFEAEGFMIEEDYDDLGDENAIAYNDDFTMLVVYYDMKDVEEASEYYEQCYKDVVDAEKDGEFKGTITKNDWQFVATGEFEDDSFLGAGECYVMGLMVDDTVMLIVGLNQPKQMNPLKNAMQTLGLM